MKWINPIIKKPEGKVFWALTEGRPEVDACDWVIRRLLNDEQGDYRSLDYAGSYYLPGSYNGQNRYNTIFAWIPFEEIYINDKELF